jgi:integrase
MLGILPEPAAAAVAVAAFTGSRKGEIRGLLWEDYDGFSITVKQAVWRSHVDEPKREKSKGAIPVIAQLRLFLERHRARSGNPRQGYILQSPQGKPLNLDALASDVACFSTRLGHEAQLAGCPRQGHPANHATRECDDHDEHLREDGFRGAPRWQRKRSKLTVQQLCSKKGWLGQRKEAKPR